MQNNYRHKLIGKGDSKTIAITFVKHGIGDDISAMPAIAQKISEGFDITVFCKPFQRYIFEKLGCKVYPSVNEKDHKEEFVKFGAFIGENFEGVREVFMLEDRFGVIYQLDQWSVCTVENKSAFYSNRSEFFAELIETTVKEDFDFVKVLEPVKIQREYILYAPDSAASNRGLKNQKKLFSSLERKSDVVMFGQNSLHHKRASRKIPKNHKDKFSIKRDEFLCSLKDSITLLKNRKLDNAKVLCNSEHEFLSYIFSAQSVVSCDNGVMNTARAFGVPHFGIFGNTPKIASEQYEKFNSAPYEVIKCEHSIEGITVEKENINFILDRTTQWQKPQIMAF